MCYLHVVNLIVLYASALDVQVLFEYVIIVLQVMEEAYGVTIVSHVVKPLQYCNLLGEVTHVHDENVVVSGVRHPE